MARSLLHLLVVGVVLVVATLGSPTTSASLSSVRLQRRAGFTDADGSAVFRQCTQRYNTSRMNPLPQQGYFNPNNGTNGSMLTIWLDGSPGEPINAIISSNSSAQVLCPEGFLRSINFGVSCLGNVNGTNQYANLGDGFGVREQGNYDGGNGVLRWNYGDTTFGTCKESIQGDNHFRWFIQNGSSAFTGAIFIAASMEESAALGHKIQRDGYNRGRDYLVGNATINQTTSYKGFVWSTKLDWIPAGVLLNATSDGINHPDVALPGQPVQDGRVALLTVTQLQEPTNLTSQNAAIPSILPLSTLLIAIPFSIIPLAITTFVL
ncbi:uncharacterized protein UMAG_05733 [Mycosarcoma maydis]|uniref:Uncharacterized protein n=1 Tax=Mycosarcoma maydis TaxID=5270 RepID=A0A0D1BYP4_MYCMD|nr:uncharacterized protein UMAG_05733 [Ustilago maydis 521]KIS66952.1 hypothetical protein UMAG_05733 [Ustilago maydis 521]|eukprot:XP_011391478.1 hypothetical protein UMAG_05733 [Ustilago maydis 521]